MLTYKRPKKRYFRRFLRAALMMTLLAIGIDYGKHWVLMRSLEDEIANSQGTVTVESSSVSFWPLLQNHIVLKGFRLNSSSAPLFVNEIHLRQGWQDWHLAHITALDTQITNTLHIQSAHGILETANLKSLVNVKNLVLTNIKAEFSLLSVTSPLASFDFLYDMSTRQISLNGDIPTVLFANDTIFGLSGQGVFYTSPPLHGRMDLKIKNIDKMMDALVRTKMVETSQAQLVTAGSHLLGTIGVHDITLPLVVKDGDVTLGPIKLFKIK